VRNLPSGTVTFLFTDIEGSTGLLETLGDRFVEALDLHRQLLRNAFVAHGGVEVDVEGDAFFAAFARAQDAVAAATDAQRALASHMWPEGVAIRVRMGIHTGEPVVTDEGYVGMDVHRGGAHHVGWAWGSGLALASDSRSPV
jgi:class 3 adenylate cyclase